MIGDKLYGGKNLAREVFRQLRLPHSFGKVHHHIELLQIYAFNRTALFDFLRIEVDQTIGVLYIHTAADARHLSHKGRKSDHHIFRLTQGIGSQRSDMEIHVLRSFLQEDA